jgi:hypothetical protein
MSDGIRWWVAACTCGETTMPVGKPVAESWAREHVDEAERDGTPTHAHRVRVAETDRDGEVLADPDDRGASHGSVSGP